MDKPRSVHEKRATKQQNPKTKKKPVKVVYISNPMRVNTTASQFRALVQELTGRDASSPESFSSSAGHQIVPAVDRGLLEVPRMELPPAEAGGEEVPDERSEVADMEPYGDVFMPQMLENFTGFLPSNLFFEASHVDVLRSLDAV